MMLIDYNVVVFEKIEKWDHHLNFIDNNSSLLYCGFVRSWLREFIIFKLKENPNEVKGYLEISDYNSKGGS